MYRWLIFNEIFLVIYYCCYSIKNTDIDVTFLVLSVLIYLCFRLLNYIFHDTRHKKYLSTLITIYIVVMYKLLDNSYILLLPINMYFLTHYFRCSHLTNVVLILMIILFLKITPLAEFALIAGFEYLFIEVYIRSVQKIKHITEENDRLRNKNSQLYDIIDKQKCYEDEIKHISQLEERNKIAQSIHDSVGHTITASIMQLEATRLLINKDIKKSDKMIQNTINVLKVGMEKIRTTLREIKPNTEELGIHNLKLFISKLEKAEGLKTTLYYNEDIDKISYIQWKIILSNVTECLTNTLKYSKATKVNLKVEVLNKIIKVEVKDNGLGNLVIKKGLGLLGMQERVESANGKLIIDGSNGFSVITLLPIVIE
ncbi:sensor histidine kinase [Clostridiaceae bacterium M8S5]|nr:sensor histidine kinase [Clostridiaceae bacterium M8S5]